METLLLITIIGTSISALYQGIDAFAHGLALHITLGGARR